MLIYDFVWTASSPAPSLNTNKKEKDGKRLLSLLQEIASDDKSVMFGWCLYIPWDGLFMTLVITLTSYITMSFYLSPSFSPQTIFLSSLTL